jgi:hypothetical protein
MLSYFNSPTNHIHLNLLRNKSHILSPVNIDAKERVNAENIRERVGCVCVCVCPSRVLRCDETHVYFKAPVARVLQSKALPFP